MVRHGETYSNVNSRKMDTVGFEPTTSRKCVSAKRARYPCAKSPCSEKLNKLFLIRPSSPARQQTRRSREC